MSQSRDEQHRPGLTFEQLEANSPLGPVYTTERLLAIALRGELAGQVTTRVMLERLADELGDLDRLVWTNDTVDVGELRDRVSIAMTLASDALDGLQMTSDDERAHRASCRLGVV
jgi:hypothetical protein